MVNGLWNSPTPKSLGAIGNRVLGGWQLGIIASAQMASHHAQHRHGQSGFAG